MKYHTYKVTIRVRAADYKTAKAKFYDILSGKKTRVLMIEQEP